MQTNLQSTISTESDFVNDGLRNCVVGVVIVVIGPLLAQSTVSIETFKPVRPLKYSVVDVSK